MQSDSESLNPESTELVLEGDDASYTVSATAAPYEVDVGAAQFSISEVVRKIDRGQIALAPDYQRNDVWSDARRSGFIESILLNIPLPPIYLNQLMDGTYVVIDGKQRLTAIYRFVKGHYVLSSLARWVSLNGARFGELPPALQARIEDRQIACHVLKASVPLELVYEIFHRINTGGVQLNRPEIRNGILQGPATDLLRKLAAVRAFSEATGGMNPVRMKDQELALRCLAFHWKDPQIDYNGDMDVFITNTMRDLNKTDAATRDHLVQVFSRTMRWCATLFGDGGFRLPTEKQRGRVNIALAEAVFRWVAMRSDAELTSYSSKIKANHNALVANSRVRELSSWNTGDRGRLRERFNLVAAMLSEGTC